MMSSMKMMNNMMPLMSAFFCFTLPIGMGIYWIAGAVIRSIQQIVINKYIDSMNLDEIIEKNKKKYEEKLKKKGSFSENISKKLYGENGNTGKTVKEASQKSEEEKKKEREKANEYLKKTESKNKGDGSKKSLADRVNMVKEYNERNNK